MRNGKNSVGRGERLCAAPADARVSWECSCKMRPQAAVAPRIPAALPAHHPAGLLRNSSKWCIALQRWFRLGCLDPCRPDRSNLLAIFLHRLCPRAAKPLPDQSGLAVLACPV